MQCDKRKGNESWVLPGKRQGMLPGCWPKNCWEQLTQWPPHPNGCLFSYALQFPLCGGGYWILFFLQMKQLSTTSMYPVTGMICRGRTAMATCSTPQQELSPVHRSQQESRLRKKKKKKIRKPNCKYLISTWKFPPKLQTQGEKSVFPGQTQTF